MKLFKLMASLLLLFVAAPAVFAGEIKPYTQAEFDRLTAQGKPVLIQVYADWCPTCKAQKPLLDQLMREDKYKNVTMLVINFDTERNLLKTYNVRAQSTLIAFKGKQEEGRSVGDTSQAGIEALLGKVVN